MKKNLILSVLCATILFSCSSDSDDNDGGMDSNSLVGTWNLTDARFEEDPNDTSLNLADEALDVLAAQNCYLVSFTFNANGSATSTDRVNYLTFDAGPTGLVVDCPDQSDMESFNWSLEGDQLTLTDDNDVSETITIELEGNTLIIAGDEIDANNYAGAEAIFTRQ